MIQVSTKNGQKTASMHIVHFCNTYDITVKCFGWCENGLNFLTNQNKHYYITLIKIKWLQNSFFFKDVYDLFDIKSSVLNHWSQINWILFCFFFYQILCQITQWCLHPPDPKVHFAGDPQGGRITIQSNPQSPN